MFKANRFLAIIVLLLFVAIMGSCGGGGGDDGGGSGGGGTTPPPADSSSDGPTSNASASGDEELRVVAGSTNFTPPVEPIIITKNTFQSEKSSEKSLKTAELVAGVQWTSQIPPCSNWYDTANCGPASYLMAEAFYKGYDISGSNAEEGIKGIIDWLAEKAGNDVPPYRPPWKAGIDKYCGDISTDSQLAKLAIMRGGFGSRATIGASADILLQELKRGYPVIVRVLSQGKNYTDEMIVNENNKCLGHYMLLIGMDSTWVYVNDPGRDSEQNGKKRYTLESFIRVWGTPHCDDQTLYNRAISLSRRVGIIFSSLTLPVGKVNQQYDAVLSAIDGFLPYGWFVINGGLPPGIYLTSDGRLTGMPQQEGNFPFTIKVIDSTNDFAEAKTSITISSSAVVPPLMITMPRELPMEQMGVSYDVILSLAGGTYPYNWSLIGGSLPNGLSLTANGRITGIPTKSGIYIFNVQVTDSSLLQQTTSKEFVVNILSSNQEPQIVSLTANPSTVNPNGTSSIVCNASDPDGDPLTYSWTATGGSIPGSSSTVTWTAPSAIGNYTITCSVSDGKGGTASKGVDITVSESTTPLSITPTSLPTGTVGVSYPATNLSATGGKPPYTWSIVSGSLPLGLTLSAGGVISGTPTTAETYNFTVQVNDSGSPQQTATSVLSIGINTATTYSISGRITLNGSGLLGVTLTGAGSTTTDSGGNYTFSGVQNGSYTITPSMAGYTFSPSNRAVLVNNANVTGQDFTATSTTPPPTTFSFSPTSSSVSEGAGSTSFTLNRSSSSVAQTVYVSTTTTEGYLNSSDYVGINNQTVSFAVGESSKTITISIINDSAVEPDETFGLITQQNSTDPVSTYLAKATFTITNDDSAPCNPPSSFTLNANAYCNTTPPVAPAVMLNWTTSTGASSYDIYRDGTLYSSGIIGTSFDNNANVVAGQAYTYYVMARNLCGNTQSNTVTVTVPSNICLSSPVERITNGSFSSGPSGWILMYDFWAGTDGSYPWTPPGYAAGGVDSSGYPKNNATGWMYQTVTIPSNATSATLSFWYNITSAASDSGDMLNVTIQNSTGGYLATVAVLPGVNNSAGYSQITFNATPYKGQTIRVNFLATTDTDTNTTIFRIDDVSLMSDGN